jgi:site-specific DNA recombinase
VTRVCLYLRISTDEDHQPTSLRTQRERLERYCEAMEDWRIVATYEDQASGTTLDRPGLQQALTLARERRFDLLLVYRVDPSPGRCASWPRCTRSSRSSRSS